MSVMLRNPSDDFPTPAEIDAAMARARTLRSRAVRDGLFYLFAFVKRQLAPGTGTRVRVSASSTGA